MGLTIRSKRYSCDMSGSGFRRFRNLVAEKTNSVFYNHYLLLTDIDVIMLSGIERKGYFEAYDKKTKEMIDAGLISLELADFLYKSDMEGAIDRKQAKIIFNIIKDCDGDIPFGYIGRSDCARMSDIKKIFSDKTKVKWF